MMGRYASLGFGSQLRESFHKDWALMKFLTEEESDWLVSAVDWIPKGSTQCQDRLSLMPLDLVIRSVLLWCRFERDWNAYNPEELPLTIDLYSTVRLIRPSQLASLKPYFLKYPKTVGNWGAAIVAGMAFDSSFSADGIEQYMQVNAMHPIYTALSLTWARGHQKSLFDIEQIYLYLSNIEELSGRQCKIISSFLHATQVAAMSGSAASMDQLESRFRALKHLIINTVTGSPSTPILLHSASILAVKYILLRVFDEQPAIWYYNRVLDLLVQVQASNIPPFLLTDLCAPLSHLRFLISPDVRLSLSSIGSSHLEEMSWIAKTYPYIRVFWQELSWTVEQFRTHFYYPRPARLEHRITWRMDSPNELVNYWGAHSLYELEPSMTEFSQLLILHDSTVHQEYIVTDLSVLLPILAGSLLAVTNEVFSMEISSINGGVAEWVFYGGGRGIPASQVGSLTERQVRCFVRLVVHSIVLKGTLGFPLKWGCWLTIFEVVQLYETHRAHMMSQHMASIWTNNALQIVDPEAISVHLSIPVVKQIAKALWHTGLMERFTIPQLYEMYVNGQTADGVVSDQFLSSCWWLAN